MSGLAQDVRYALRLLGRSPGFVLVAVASLALGVGANTAIFSVVNAVLLRSLPYPHPERLVKLVTLNRGGVGARDIGLSVPELDDLRTASDIFEEVSVTWPASANLTGAERPERLEMLAVSPNYFAMLGTGPQLGRVLDRSDEAAGFAEGVVISDSLWASGFGRDPRILGRKLQLDDDPYTIVGVLPPGFRHPGRTVATDVQVWLTAGFRANPFPKPARSVRLLPGAIGLLRPGITREEAQSRLNVFASRLRAEYPDDYPPASGWFIEVEALQESLVGKVRPMLWSLMGAVSLIILLASVNIANLLLARASARQREIAVRLALGAGRARVMRQMLIESLLLAVLSGAVGILTASAALRFIRFLPTRIPRLAEVQVDWTVLAFALLVSLLAGLVFGLVPALQHSKADLSTTLREGGRGSGTSGRTSRLRRLLIASELALAVVLMVGAGLLLRTFFVLLGEPPGFNPSHVVTAGLWLPAPNNPDLDRYGKPESFNSFVREVLRGVDAIPGIERAALTTDLPVTHSSRRLGINLEDRPVGSAEGQVADVTRVTPDYFNVIEASLLRGRLFGEGDEPGRELVVIVDESAAHGFWPDRDPIGRRLKVGRGPAPSPWRTVVGVIRNIKNEGLDQIGIPHVYAPIYQVPGFKSLSVVARTSSSTSDLEPQIRRSIEAIDPGLPVFNLRTMDEVIDASLASRRFSAELVGASAGLALLLSSIGVYGLLAYMVGQRSPEIAVRMALGAPPAAIGRMVLGQGAALAGAGVLIGLLLSAMTAPTIATLLYGVHPLDPVVFVGVPLVLMAVALLASYLPARRAARVNPTVALRDA